MVTLFFYQLPDPFILRLHDGKLLVSEHAGDRLALLTEKGRFERYIGSKGRGKGGLVGPLYLAQDYLERIYSPYVGISKQFGKKLSLDASVTVENYNSLRWNEWRVYPSLNAMWNINKDNMLNLSFNSNAKYPSYWSTMSSIYYMSSYSELWGNPELKSASIYKLNLMWRHKQRYSVSLFADLKVDNATQQAYQPSLQTGRISQ